MLSKIDALSASIDAKDKATNARIDTLQTTINQIKARVTTFEPVKQ